jgi:hypothetical protein
MILPLTAKGTAQEWRSAGFLVRRPSSEARGETLELSPMRSPGSASCRVAPPRVRV